MAAVASAIWGKEQLILLPVQPQVFTLQTDPPGQVLMQSGIHAVVASGYIGINPTAGGFGLWVLGDDDDIFTWDVKQTVGPLWRRIQQVSASVAMAGIESRDADEVDHSQWVVAASRLSFPDFLKVIALNNCAVALYY